ncbi:hypothetical protein [Ornithinibacillus scapharcae]|uniref:hypothetical protein n=1 Tax=Ornithinibacillus scapharcae TaxID=1147159 RepID=UPI000225B794|nr:hypothetical protein [Ornithinibacillus scapharcae]
MNGIITFLRRNSEGEDEDGGSHRVSEQNFINRHGEQKRNGQVTTEVYDRFNFIIY